MLSRDPLISSSRWLWTNNHRIPSRRYGVRLFNRRPGTGIDMDGNWRSNPLPSPLPLSQPDNSSSILLVVMEEQAVKALHPLVRVVVDMEGEKSSREERRIRGTCNELANLHPVRARSLPSRPFWFSITRLNLCHNRTVVSWVLIQFARPVHLFLLHIIRLDLFIAKFATYRVIWRSRVLRGVTIHTLLMILLVLSRL